MLHAIVAGMALIGGVQLATSEQFYWLEDAETPPLGQVAVYKVGLITGYRGQVSPCTYKGVFVPYERDWEERQTILGFDRTLPPAPGEVYGIVSVVLSEQCPGAPAKPVLWVGATQSWQKMEVYTTPAWQAIINGNVARGGISYKEMPAILAENPKWKDQVFRRIDTAAETNPEIAEMLTELKEKGPQPLFQSGPKTPF